MPTLWERQTTDTKASYIAFLDYCEMGVKRSLRGLVEYYLKQSSSNPQAKQPTKKESTLFTWSVTGNWQERVDAWDEWQLAERLEAHQAAITQLIDDELEDYEYQLQKWHAMADKTHLHDRKKRSQEEGGIIVEFVALQIGDWHELSKWRDDIAKQGRRALGLPDKISRDEHSGPGGKAIEQRNVNVNVQADSVQDIGAILDQLAAMGAIPPEASENGHHAATDGVHGASADGE